MKNCSMFASRPRPVPDMDTGPSSFLSNLVYVASSILFLSFTSKDQRPYILLDIDLLVGAMLYIFSSHVQTLISLRDLRERS